MDILKNLKLNTWWSIMIWCGVALFASGMILEIEIVNRKHIIGISIGMFIVGMSNFAACRPVYIPRREYGTLTGYTDGNVIIHNKWTKTGVLIGWVLIICYGALLLWGLVYPCINTETQAIKDKIDMIVASHTALLA